MSRRGTSLYHAFLRTAARDPNGAAWIECEVGHHDRGDLRTWRWSELADRVHRAAAWLVDANVTVGDRVANTLRNGVEWAVLDLACSAIGAIHAPLDPRSPTATLLACVEQLRPKLTFAEDTSKVPGAVPLAPLRHNAMRPSFAMLNLWEREVQDENVACILFTSGTTNAPRGVMLTHSNLVSNSNAKLDAMPQDASDVRLNFLPFAHAYARTCELSTWMLAGGTMACAFGFQDVLALAPRLQPSLINGVPSFYNSLYERFQENRVDELCAKTSVLGARIRRLASGGAPIASSLRRAFVERGLPIFQGYGLTEASPVVCSNRAATLESNEILCGVGPPVEGVEIRIDNDNRIWVRGKGVMKGYWGDPSGTDSKIVNGWLDTGDIAAPAASLDREIDVAKDHSNAGAATPLMIAGRVDDLQVLSTGYKFLPQPIEHRIAQLPEIERCVLIGNRRRHAVLLARLNNAFADTNRQVLLSRVRELLEDVPEYAKPREVIIDTQPWGIANGRLQWKGGVDRHSIERLIDAMSEPEA